MPPGVGVRLRRGTGSLISRAQGPSRLRHTAACPCSSGGQAGVRGRVVSSQMELCWKQARAAAGRTVPSRPHQLLVTYTSHEASLTCQSSLLLLLHACRDVVYSACTCIGVQSANKKCVWTMHISNSAITVFSECLHCHIIHPCCSCGLLGGCVLRLAGIDLTCLGAACGYRGSHHDAYWGSLFFLFILL